MWQSASPVPVGADALGGPPRPFVSLRTSAALPPPPGEVSREAQRSRDGRVRCGNPHPSSPRVILSAAKDLAPGAGSENRSFDCAAARLRSR